MVRGLVGFRRYPAPPGLDQQALCCRLAASPTTSASVPFPRSSRCRTPASVAPATGREA